MERETLEKIENLKIFLEDFDNEVEEVELCRQLRKLTVVPILFLTNKTDEAF